jgi:hypothetical protein
MHLKNAGLATRVFFDEISDKIGAIRKRMAAGSTVEEHFSHILHILTAHMRVHTR